MRVAMWTSWDTRCGIAAYTGSLVPELQELGVEVEIVPVPYTDRSPETMARNLERLNAADLIHLQHEYTFWGGVAPRSSSLPHYLSQLRKPHVVTAHTVFTAAELLRLEQETRPRQRLAKRLLASLPSYRASVERQPFAGARAVIVHTEAARERMLGRGLRPERVHVLPAGIPPPHPVTPDAVEAMRSRLGLTGARVLTIFGYVTPDKGYHVALQALKGMPPAVKLLIAGGTRVEHETAYMEQLRGEIDALGLGRRVVISGYLEDEEVAAAMALSDVVLVPHTAANGSYSVMIALSYEKPVLASDLACFEEIHRDSGALELFPSGDEQSLAERAGFLLATASARRQLAERAAAYAARRSWRSVAERTLEIYRTP